VVGIKVASLIVFVILKEAGYVLIFISSFSARAGGAETEIDAQHEEEKCTQNSTQNDGPLCPPPVVRIRYDLFLLIRRLVLCDQ
jgi:hypothetical protein